MPRNLRPPTCPGRVGLPLTSPLASAKFGLYLAAGRLSRRRSRGVAWPNTRPCQGRERRFESGRDRHQDPPQAEVCVAAVPERWPSPVEGDGLENRYGSLAHREFKSLPLRQNIGTSGPWDLDARRLPSQLPRALSLDWSDSSPWHWLSASRGLSGPSFLSHSSFTRFRSWRRRSCFCSPHSCSREREWYGERPVRSLTPRPLC